MLSICCLYKEDRSGSLRSHTWPSPDRTISHHHYGVHRLEFRSARPDIYTELQIYDYSPPRLDLQSTKGSIHHNRRIFQESSERTNLRYSYTHCKEDHLHFPHGERSHRCHILLRTLRHHLRYTW